MNVKSFQTSDYDDFCRFELGKNKANSNPIKANLQRAKMDVNIYYKEVYENIWQRPVRKNKPNSNPIQTQTKPISDYPCVFELAMYNLVLRDGNMTNFDGDITKWQKRRKQTQ